MGWDGAGGYDRQRNFSADASANIRILASAVDEELDDFASAMQNCLTLDGQNSPTTNIPLGGNRLVNGGQPASATDYIRVKEVIENVPVYMIDTASSSDRISVSAAIFTAVSANQAPAGGTGIKIKMLSDKSTAPLHLNGYSANVLYDTGGVVGEGLTSGGIYEFIYNSAASSWQAINFDTDTSRYFVIDVTTSADRVSAAVTHLNDVDATNAPSDGEHVRVKMASDKSTCAIYINDYSSNIHNIDGQRANNVLTSAGIYDLVYSSTDSYWQVLNTPEDQTRYKKGTEDRSSATISNDTHLIGWVLKPATIYQLDMSLWMRTTTSVDTNIKWVFTSDQTPGDTRYGGVLIKTGTSTAPTQAIALACTTTASADLDTSYRVFNGQGLWLTHDTNVENVNFQWSQAVTSSNPTRILRGSYIKFTRLGPSS